MKIYEDVTDNLPELETILEEVSYSIGSASAFIQALGPTLYTASETGIKTYLLNK